MRCTNSVRTTSVDAQGVPRLSVPFFVLVDSLFCVATRRFSPPKNTCTPCRRSSEVRVLQSPVVSKFDVVSELSCILTAGTFVNPDAGDSSSQSTLGPPHTPDSYTQRDTTTHTTPPPLLAHPAWMRVLDSSLRSHTLTRCGPRFLPHANTLRAAFLPSHTLVSPRRPRATLDRAGHTYLDALLVPDRQR